MVNKAAYKYLFRKDGTNYYAVQEFILKLILKIIPSKKKIIIMCGGGGQRLWPLSKPSFPNISKSY